MRQVGCGRGAMLWWRLKKKVGLRFLTSPRTVLRYLLFAAFCPPVIVRKTKSPLATLCILPLLYMIPAIIYYQLPDIYTDHKALIVDTSKCRIRDFDPFDTLLKGYIYPLPISRCDISPPVILQNGSTFHLSQESLRIYYMCEPQDTACTYQEVGRNRSANIPDDTVVLSEEANLTFGVPVNAEYIKVECRCRINGEIFYTDYFFLPILKRKMQSERKFTSAMSHGTNDRLSVIILGLDSLSRLNFKRHMKQTRDYIERFKPFEMLGMTKVGDNTFPNCIALLTGKKGNEVNESCSKSFFDEEDLIWKKYSQQGYYTLFLEEMSKYGLFTHFCRGFRDAPVDYYPRPLMLSVSTSPLKFFAGGRPCVGSRDGTSVHMSYISSVLTLLKDKFHFSFTWIIDATHGNVNGADYVDAAFRATFERLEEAGVMNRSVVLFMSDHGTRFGNIRLLLTGKYEDRLPFCFLMFPPAFHQKYRPVIANLRENQHRLTTPFDLHATLLELSQLPASLDKQEFRTKYGTSLLHEIPEDRTCEDASISPHWCCCQRTREVYANSQLAVRMAAFVLDTVNGWLEEAVPGRCVPLELGAVHSVQKRLLTHVEDGTLFFWVTLEASNTGALLESTVSVNRTGGMNVVDMVNRLNRMGPMGPACVNRRVLELYCVCRNMTVAS
ncbi:uncharacterized protein LOC135365988 [Ornithodoros turicata]|uniref:uncharacterized protein LOC135365988 n=1 Tax=Ornithodoros turicata TaxID=34597 RepID=UPI00313A3627